jgi:hypothetical protein
LWLRRAVFAVKAGCIYTPAPNGNDSLSPSKRGEGWGEGFVLVNIGLLTPALFSLKKAREKNGAGFKMRLLKSASTLKT